MYSYVFVSMCTHMYRYVERSEKGIRSSGAGVTSGSESPSLIVGNQTQDSDQERLLLPTELPLQPLLFRRSCPDFPPLAHLIRSGGRGEGGTGGKVKGRNS